MFKDQNELTEFIKANRSESITIRDIYYGILDRLGLLDEKKKAQLLWRRAYREAMQNKDKKSEETPKFKIVTMSDGSGRKYIHATERVIKSKNPDMWESEIMNYVNNVVRNGEDVVIPFENEESIVITERTAWKVSGKGNVKGDYYLVKGNAAGVIDEIVAVSKSVDSSPPYKEHSKGFAKYGFDYRTAYFMDINGKYYKIKLSVGINADGKEAYDFENIERMTFPSPGSKAHAETATGKSSSTPRVTQNETGVKQKNSVSGTRLSEYENGSELENLTRENAELRAQLDNMTRFNISKSMQNTAEIRRAAQDLKSGYGSKMSVSAIQSELTELYNYMVGKDTRNDEGVRNRIHSLAERVIAQATETVTDEQYQLRHLAQRR